MSLDTTTWAMLRERLASPVSDPAPSGGSSAAHLPRPATVGFRPQKGLGAGQTFGRYVVLRELAAGAMYRVLLAEDPLARRLVAIKTLRWEYVTNDTVAFCLARLDRQAQAAGRLCHPHLVKVFDRGSDFLVLEHLQGLNLSTILRERGRLELGRALRLLAPLAAALDHMHSRGVVHRDVKPANVIVLADGSPTLIDFGASCLADRPLETWDRLLGTPSHMAPEQVLHGTANALTDVFSFAVLAYELITGEQPFRGDSVGSITYRVAYEPAPPPTRRANGLPAAYDEIFARMLAKEPERRLPTASAFVGALESGRDRRTVPPTPSFDSLDAQERDPARLRERGPRLDDESCIVEIGSEPRGAQVWWNGVERGRTPLRICETSAGPHALKLVLGGHSSIEAGFTVPQAPSLRIEFTMVPAPAPRILDFRPRRDE